MKAKCPKCGKTYTLSDYSEGDGVAVFPIVGITCSCGAIVDRDIHGLQKKVKDNTSLEPWEVIQKLYREELPKVRPLC